VSVINAESMAVTATIPAGGSPTSTAVHPDGTPTLLDLAG
jgi:DNA-binding beta-propeller fold protein YncE